MDLDIEPGVLHVLVNLYTGIPFSKVDAFAMPLHNLDDEFQNRESATVCVLYVSSLVIVPEMELKPLI